MKARAVRIREPGDPSVLDIVEVDVRDPGPDEVAVAVAASAVNRADLLQRRGLYPPPEGFPPDLLGMEYAGTVATIGANVRSHKVGDRVMGIIGSAGMATRVVVPSLEAIPVPENLSLPEAAAIPEVWLTAYDALFVQAELQNRESVLVHAVGSGVGTALLQLAREIADATVIGTSRTADKIERAKPFGLTHGIVATDNQFADHVRKVTPDGVNVIVDPVGAAYLEENVRSIALKGRIVLYGSLGGVSGELPIAILMSRRARIIGTVLRSRSPAEKAELAQRFTLDALPLFAKKKLHPVIADVMPMSRVREAHERMERNETFGKLVLTW